MDLRRDSREPCSKSLLVSTLLGTIRRYHSQIWRARIEPMHHDPAEPADLETASLPGADDIPAEQKQLADQAIEEQNQQADQADRREVAHHLHNQVSRY